MTGHAVLALDIGAAGGWATNAPRATRRSGAWQFPPGTLGRGERFRLLHEMLHKMMVSLKIECVVYERPFARGYHATRNLWGYAAMIEAAAAEAGCACVDITPGEIKSYTTGTGKASKAQMTEAMRQRGYVGSNEHEADALCLLAYAEAKIEWPSEADRDHRDRASKEYGELTQEYI